MHDHPVLPILLGPARIVDSGDLSKSPVEALPQLHR
jgi:hypothetical protein